MQISSTQRAIPLHHNVTRGFTATLRANSRLTGCQRRIIVDKNNIQPAPHMGPGFFASTLEVNGDKVRVTWQVRHGKLETGAKLVSDIEWHENLEAYEARQEAIAARAAELKAEEAARKAAAPVDVREVATTATPSKLIFTNREAALEHFGKEKLSSKNGKLLFGAALKGRLKSLGAKLVFPTKESN